jgi:hypothetical protein
LLIIAGRLVYEYDNKLNHTEIFHSDFRQRLYQEEETDASIRRHTVSFIRMYTTVPDNTYNIIQISRLQAAGCRYQIVLSGDSTRS